MQKYNYSFFNRIITKLKTLWIDLFHNPILVNACLFYSYGRLVHRNWGDDINHFFIECIFRRKISYLYNSSLSMRRNSINYLMIGSTIDQLCNSQTIIWGAGVIDGNSELPAKPLKVLAVRGPLTRQYLLNNGVDVAPVYGDPALLLKYWYRPNVIKKYRLGIIPHFDDFDHPALVGFKNDPKVLMIKMEGYKNWLEVLDQICSCEYIASSSLHGLIMSEAYDIPNLWIELSGKLMGGHFKFHDFFLSMDQDRYQPYVVKEGMSLDEIMATLSSYKKGSIDLNPLINSAPFNIYLKNN